MNFTTELASSIGIYGDDSYRCIFLKDSALSVSFGSILLDLQIQWQGIKSEDVTLAVEYSANMDSGHAAYEESKEQSDSQTAEQETAPWENGLKGCQAEINIDTDNRKGNFNLAQGLASMLQQIISLMGVL